MRKLNLLLAFAILVAMPVFAQRPVSDPPPGSENSINDDLARSCMLFESAGKVYSLQGSELPKFGGVPATVVAFTDDFSLPNDTNGLKARGYIPYYRGAGPMGLTPSWYQGNTTAFTDFNNGNADLLVF